MDDQRGQASIELVAGLPALLLAGLLALQLLAAGYALTLADGAAEAGALALASGRPAADAVRDALPGWADDDVAISVGGGRVTVRLRPPSPLPSVADRLAVSSSAFARPPEGAPAPAHIGVLDRSRAERATLQRPKGAVRARNASSLICLARCALR